MKFKLSVASTFVDDKRRVKYEKLGFKYKPNDWHYNKDREPWTTTIQDEPTIEINRT